MAKIGLYADLHTSYSSSILPVYCEGSKYTTRLQMIVDTGKWMYNLFDQNNVDYICNLGDTFDSHTVRAEELSAISEFYSYSHGLREITIIGNHEMLNHNFYATSVLKNYDFIEVYDSPCKLDDCISVLPYMDSEDITYNLLKSISNKILLSHIDIKGSYIRPDYIMPSGVESEALSMYFESVFNGHIHTAEKINTSTNLVMNIGSISSISFSDSNTYIPSVCIYDTDSMKLERFNNTNAILFRRVEVSNVSEFIKYVNNLDKSYRYALRISCPYNIRDAIKKIASDNENIIVNKVVAIIDNSSRDIKKLDIVKSNDSDIKSDFLNFIKNNSSILSAPIDEYISILKDVKVN